MEVGRCFLNGVGFGGENPWIVVIPNILCHFPVRFICIVSQMKYYFADGMTDM